jgi:hypothetical protein
LVLLRDYLTYSPDFIIKSTSYGYLNIVLDSDVKILSLYEVIKKMKDYNKNGKTVNGVINK